jgi:hypothetical protein
MICSVAGSSALQFVVHEYLLLSDVLCVCSPADFSSMKLLGQVCELFETRWVGIKLGQSREERECGACRGCEGLGPEFFIDP